MLMLKEENVERGICNEKDWSCIIIQILMADGDAEAMKRKVKF